MTGIPPARRRLLGAALRRYRENLGYDLADAARVLDCDRSKISRIETGQRGISRRDLRDLLGEYGVGEEVSRALEAIGDPRRARGWWREYGDVLPEPVQDYLILEAAAAEMLVYETQQVPGLLQTADYAQAVAGACLGVPAGLEARLASAWLTRQEHVLAPDGPVVSVVVGEAALRQAVGGTALMRTQLARLAAASAGGAQVTVRVLPFAAGAAPGDRDRPGHRPEVRAGIWPGRGKTGQPVRRRPASRARRGRPVRPRVHGTAGCCTWPG